MPSKKILFLGDKQFLPKLVKQGQNSYIKVDLPNRIIESFRVRLTPLNIVDIEKYYKLYSDEDVMSKYCGGNIRSKYEVDELIKNYIGEQEPSYFSIFEKDTSLFIGSIFLTTKNQNKGEIMLGYLIDKNFWGKNYAKEAVYSLVFCLLPLTRNEIRVVTATEIII
jgi:RimJ/RimL family protein N-acetyltransferase